MQIGQGINIYEVWNYFALKTAKPTYYWFNIHTYLCSWSFFVIHLFDHGYSAFEYIKRALESIILFRLPSEKQRERVLNKGEYLQSSCNTSQNVSRFMSLGLPWWHSGQESSCQCRGHGFEPWSGKIPHAAEQLSPCATTTEPAL